jgi:iron(III) transport system ATP-binding protein
MVFRPQDVRLVTANDQVAPDSAKVSGVVAYREFLGAMVRYGVRIGETDIAVDTPFHAGDVLQEVGTPITLAIATHTVRWLSN